MGCSLEKVFLAASAVLLPLRSASVEAAVFVTGAAPAGRYGSDYAGVRSIEAVVAGLGALLFIKFLRGGKGGGKGSDEKTVSGPQGPHAPFLGDLKRADEGFDPEKFCKMASGLFVRVQSAWRKRDLERVREHLTEDLFQGMASELEKAIARGSVSHIEDITVRAPVITGAWQDEGLDFITVRITADATALTTGRDGRPVGDAPKKVSLTEYWTFVREVWMGDWRLTAIGREQG